MQMRSAIFRLYYTRKNRPNVCPRERKRLYTDTGNKTEKETIAKRGVIRCMKRPFPVSKAFKLPVLGPKNRKTVSRVTVTAAVPIYLRTHAQFAPGSRHINKAVKAQNTLLSSVKKRNAKRTF